MNSDRDRERGAWDSLRLGIQEGPPRGGDSPAVRLGVCKGPENQSGYIGGRGAEGRILGR